MTALDDWIEREARVAVSGMLRAISATRIIKERPDFGQRIAPRPGSVLASPVLAAYDPDPDYFFHWFRDSAIVIDALRAAREDGRVDATAVDRLGEFVEFSRTVRGLDGREFIRDGRFRDKVQPSFLQYVRPNEEIAAVIGAAALAEARVNPDGTLDFTRWARPQNDGPALEVLALTRWREAEPGLEATLQATMLELAIGDLDFILSRARAPSFDIWEEERGYHHFTQLVQAEALAAAPNGSRKRARLHAPAPAAPPRTRSRGASRPIGHGGWLLSLPHERDRRRLPQKALDIAVILGVLHAGRARGVRSVLDPKAQATLTALEDLFEG